MKFVNNMAAELGQDGLVYEVAYGLVTSQRCLPVAFYTRPRAQRCLPSSASDWDVSGGKQSRGRHVLMESVYAQRHCLEGKHVFRRLYMLPALHLIGGRRRLGLLESILISLL